MLVLTANKTRKMRLVRSFGFDPPKDAEFSKSFRRRSWWLGWWDKTTEYRAILDTAANKAFLGLWQQDFDSDEPPKWTSWTIPPEKLQEFGLAAELKTEKN